MSAEKRALYTLFAHVHFPGISGNLETSINLFRYTSKSISLA